MYDIKDTDSDRLKQYTGGNFSEITDNLFALDRTNKSILRCILVFGVNTDEKHYAFISEIYSSLKNCLGVQFLPYHPYGGSKATSVFGKSNAHEEWIPPKTCIDGAKSFLQERNVTVVEE